MRSSPCSTSAASPSTTARAMACVSSGTLVARTPATMRSACASCRRMAGRLSRADAFSFTIASDLTIVARLVPRQTRVASGATAVLDARIENRGTNTPLLRGWRGSPDPADGSRGARSSSRRRRRSRRCCPAGSGPQLRLAGGGAAGLYDAELTVFRTDVSQPCHGSASLEVTAEKLSLAGSLALSRRRTSWRASRRTPTLTITNRSGVGCVGPACRGRSGRGIDGGRPRASHDDPRPRPRRDAHATRAARHQRPRARPLSGLPAKVGEPAQTLDRAVLRLHGAITPPAIYAPVDGSRVATSHPASTVDATPRARKARRSSTSSRSTRTPS